MIDVSERLGLWVPQVQGQYINEDRGYGAQCWDLASNWAQFLGLPVINTGGPGRWSGWAGNMVDAFPQTDAIAAAYELISPDAAGQPGDTAVWGDSYWYYPKTHVAVLVGDKGAQLLCMSQNSTPARADNPYPGDSTGPTTLQHLPRQGLIGFLRPRTGGGLAAQGTITPQEDDMPITDADANKVAAAAVALIMTEQKNGNTLGEMIGEARGHAMDIMSAVGKVPDTLLDTAMTGVAGDTITMRQFLKEYRAHIIQMASGIAAEKAATGASADEIKQAVAEGLSAGIHVDATVTVGGK